MKKFSIMMSVVALLAMGCGSQKALQKEVAQAEIDVDMPCSGPEFQCTKEYFRAHAFGTSTDRAMAQDKARQRVREELATTMNATVKRVVDNYASSYTSGSQEEVKGRFEQLGRTVVNEMLSGSHVICEKMRQSTVDGKYTCYVAMELAGNEILNAMNNRIKNDEKLRIDYEYEKFKKTFDEEMSALEKEQE